MKHTLRLLTITLSVLFIGNNAFSQKKVLESVTMDNGTKRTFKYNEFGSVTERLLYDWNSAHTELFVKSKTIKTYDDSNNQLDYEFYRRNSQEDSLKKLNRIKRTYDNENRERSHTKFTPVNGILKPKSKSEIDYIGDTIVEYFSEYKNDKWVYNYKSVFIKSPSEEISYSYNYADGSWNLTSKVVLTQSANKKHKIIYDLVKGTSDTWVVYKSTESTLNSNNEVLDEIISTYNDTYGKLVPENKIVYTYDSFGNILTNIEYLNAADTIPDWVHAYEYVYTYNDKGFITSYKYYLHLFAENYLASKKEYESDEKGNLISETVYSGTTESSVLNPVSKDVYTYDDKKDGEIIFADSEYLYDSGIITTKTIYEYNNGAWKQLDLFTYNYKTIEQNTSINKQVARTVELTVYPNPVVDVLNIELNSNNSKMGIIYIYNCIGELVYQKPIDNKIETVDVSSFNKGLYFVKYNNSMAKFIKE